ncbi:ROK family transcriptional regulator [Wenxinia marina]|uniref:Transcriptional regulator, MarR family n=1 Tax=Wenxinia marina DSM 24838 TaxID=1123501 RepID=A0A0D0QBE1_9RHOB|nr:ROK family transcriptional regulator [Wenxinia marina]KIQ68223.1 transcriptional regulator, MarR family [Wenxinia marina DSM 24838]GGL76854.1 sugar kinase [Wenxinia marina]
MDGSPPHSSLTYNGRRIISAIRTHGPQSRADLARRLDIKPSTVTRLTGPMVAEGLLTEAPDPSREGRKGYPARLLSIDPRGVCTAGVYIDPDRIMTCIADLAGDALAVEETPVPDRSFEALMTEAGASVARLMERTGIDPRRMAGCGVSYPGQYSGDPTRVARIRQFRDWPEVNVERDLSPWFGMPVRHMNDAKAACMAELYHGACRGLSNFCHVWLSYGIGGAAIVDQQPYLGRNALAAEWGGLFPKSRPRPSGQDLLDVLAAEGIVLDRLSDLRDDHLELPVVRGWEERAADQLQWLCLVIARTFAPEAIVIGGTLHPRLMDGLIQAVRAAEPLGEDYFVAPPAILKAEQDGLPQLGAAALPIHEIFNPSTYPGAVSKLR